MGDFFHGWRRKIGVLTLVLACVAMCGWLRSRDNFDSISLNCSPYRRVVASAGDRLNFFRMEYVATYRFFKRFQCKLDNVVGGNLKGAGWKYQPDAYQPHAEKKIEWRWDFAGFHVSEFKSDIDLQSIWSNSTFNRDRRFVYLAVPYWAIVIPLTLLSAYLLLSKPRAKTTPEKQPPTI